MEIKTINKDIKRLYNDFYRLSFDDLENYNSFIANEGKQQFKILYYSDLDFKYMNKESALIMLRLNLRHRFIPLHLFGIYIDINF